MKILISPTFVLTVFFNLFVLLSQRCIAQSSKFNSVNNLVSSIGANVIVSPFALDQFTFGGGELTLVNQGVWYVGVDLFRKSLIALPRLGHRGWIPLARVETDSSGVTLIEQMIPSMPKTRIPRTLEKIRSGQQISVMVMGSSLAEGTHTGTWSGMLFNTAANLTAYKIPNISSFRNFALGGTPNQYMLSQLGYSAPLGRSHFLDNVDLVILTCLANDGSYRLTMIEPIIRRLKKKGVEIILLTDNPQNPTNVYSTLATSLLYRDGPEVMRIADLYGTELADTAAYVFEQHLRFGTGIYSDSIHMRAIEPAGPSSLTPAGGTEVYARAVRSVIPMENQLIGTVFNSSNFDTTVQSFTPYSQASISSVDGKLKVVKTSGTTSQWGAWVDVPSVKNGDTLRVQGTLTFEDGYNGNNLQIGMQGGGAAWGSTVRSTPPRAFDETITVTRNIVTGGRLLFFANNDSAPLHSAFAIDNVIITLNPTQTITDITPQREEEVKALPSPRQLTDLRTPSDALVILPKDEEYFRTNNTARGILGSHPGGAISFARRFLPTTSATEDLLTLNTGQKVQYRGANAVGFSLIRHALTTGSASIIEVRHNAVLVKTLNLGNGHNREHYVEILTPAEYGNLTRNDRNDIELTVTQGSLKLCALIVLSANIDPLRDYLVASNVPSNQLAANDDSDSDGVNNLLEYAIGSSPMIPDIQNQPRLSLSETNVSFTYRRVQGDGVTYRVETTADLADQNSWTDLGVYQGVISLDGTCTAILEDDDMDTKRFLRLRIFYDMINE